MNAPAIASPPSTAADPEGLDAQVRAAQVDLAFQRMNNSNWLGVPVAGLAAWLLWDEFPHAWVAGWFVLKVLTCTLRALVSRRYRRDRELRSPEYWSWQFCGALGLDGAVFGLVGTLLFPAQHPQVSAIMITTLIAIAALGLVELQMELRAALALIVPLLVPPLLFQFWTGDPIGIYTGFGMAVFLAILCLEGRRGAEHTRTTLRLRFQMNELAAQREQALELARRNSAAKDRFLATMSHEMRTPLHGILGMATMLQSASPGAADPTITPAATLRTLQLTGEHLLGIIDEVLDFSKLENGDIRPAQEPLDLAALLDSVVDVVRVTATEKGLWLRLVNPPPAPCWVLGDAIRLRRILLNLTGNAVKFTANGGVTLGVHRDGAMTVFDVIDTGVGVPVGERENIFTAFHQLDSSDGRRHGGTGLGLTISRELARAMGGDLVCLPPIAGGATFCLRLPLAGVAPPSRPASQPIAAVAGCERLSGRVLLAEDNPVNALVAGAILARIGVQVKTVPDGAEAVSEARLGGYDLILMDCQMPGVDGFEATERIRAAEREEGTRRVPIVALTANALEGDRERSLRAGMDDHLAKPFREADLARVLARFIPAAA